MLLHCIASVLLQGAGTSMSSLSHIIPQPTTSSSPKATTPGYLSQLSAHHVDVFLSALDLSYVAALRFDSRPGLKFLVQKVANIEQPANLYRQAGAAWTIKIITLFELCLKEIEEIHVDLEQVKGILGGSTEDSLKDSKFRQLTKYLKQLRTTFDELCDTYVEVVLDEDGKHTRVDSFSERKIFLLVAQPDDYPEITRKEPIDNRIATKTPAPPPVEESEEDAADQEGVEVYNPNLDDESGLEELGTEYENDPRPFRLSDLAADYSTDSGPQSEPETDDSRPASRLGSVTEKVVYANRSGGTSSEGFIDSKFDSNTPGLLEVNKSQDYIYYDLGSLWRTGSSEDLTVAVPEIKESRNNIEVKEICRYYKSRPERRRSEACLLTRKRSLKHILADNVEDRNNVVMFDSDCLRSRSAMDLRVIHDSCSDISDEPQTVFCSTLKEEDKTVSKSSKILDNIDELLRDYERSKRGFRTNPFLRDDEEMVIDNQDAFARLEFRRKGSINTDSEAHRKAWAETLSAAFEWALALSDERLAPLLPVLVGGVRVLTSHAVDQILKQRLSALFHRIVVLYGLTNN